MSEQTETPDTDRCAGLYQQIVDVLKARRANYPTFSGVADDTVEALAAWVMDVVGPAIESAYKQGESDWNLYLLRLAEGVRNEEPGAEGTGGDRDGE